MWLSVCVPQNSTESSDLTLDAQQRQVVEHVVGALRVIGPAGSGKTEALIAAAMNRLADSQGNLGESLGTAANVLVLAYDKSSAVALRQEFARRVGTGLLPTVTTFHSLAWAIASQYSKLDESDVGLRLLSGPEQDPRVRELLHWAVRGGTVQLPEEYDHALGTRGLAEEVRRLFAKALQLDLTPADLAELGRQHGIEEWAALAKFFGEYLDSTEAEGGIDYSAVLPRAAMYLDENPSDGDFVFDAIYVDEYQDVEPAQIALLKALTRRVPNPTLVVGGSPDELIFRFRGAVSDSLSEFAQDFAKLADASVTTIALENQYRLSASIGAAARAIVQRIPVRGLPTEAHRALRGPLGDENAAAGTEPVQELDQVGVELSSFVTTGAQYGQLAESIRRLKLSGEVESWSDIAVISRATSPDVQNLEQVLVSAGIPIVSLGTNVALRDEPGVRELLLLLRVALDPEQLTREHARSISLSPIGGLSSYRYRTLSRELRDIATQRHEEPKSAADAFAKALLDPERCREVKGEGAEQLVALADLIAKAQVYAIKDPAYEVLWLLWSSTRWPDELHDLALSPSSLSRSANRTLDAVVALFEVIRRGERVTGTSMSPQMLLDELDFQGFTPDLGPLDSDKDGVRLLSAHGAKGLSWPVVFVIDLQEGMWPRVSHSVSLLKTDRLSTRELAEPTSVIDQIRDERRLLYVAMTRASERLFVSCVSDDIESTRGASPSRFFNELVGLAAREPELGIVHTLNQGVAPRSLTTSSLVAQLRHVLEDSDASLELKHAAANRLGILEQAGVRAADPGTWWGLREWSVAERPVRNPEEPLRMSGSTWKDLEDCSLKWFLDREAGGGVARGASTAFGSIVHALADAVASGDVEPNVDELRTHVEHVWHKLGIEAQWQNVQEKTAVMDALTRFLNWQDPEPRERELLATEQRFDAVVQTDIDPDSPKIETQAHIVGVADRLELDAEGRTVVVDLKNQKNHPSRADVAKHKQLWLYQLAVMVGAFDGEAQVEIPRESGGAELIQLRTDKVGPTPTEQRQPAVDAEELRGALKEAVQILRTEDFQANPNSDLCKFCSFQPVCPGKAKGAEVID